jgi:hypothetical protein
MALVTPDVGEVEQLARMLYGRGGLITAATNANPIVVTSNAHGLAVNDHVVVSDVGGNTAANGTFVVSAVTTNTFTLSGSTGNGAYTSGGSWSLTTMEDWTLKLRSDGVTPAESDTAGSYTEATFTGYSAKTINSVQAVAKWPKPSTGSGTTSSTYGTTLSWSPTTSQTITGYFVIGATSTTLLFAENFASSKSLSNGDTFNLTLKMQLD